MPLFRERLGAFQAVASVLGPGVQQGEPFKSCFSIHYSLVGLMGMSLLTFEARCFGVSSLRCGLESWGL